MKFARSQSPYFSNLVYFGLVRLIVIGSGNANIEIAKGINLLSWRLGSDTDK